MLFVDEREYAAFIGLLVQMQTRVSMPIISYCLMPTHWHLVVWPPIASTLSTFMHRLTLNHARQHNVDRGLLGTGHVYQGRFGSVSVKDDRHLLTLLRYVEANPRVAGLVARAEDWKWSSLCVENEGPTGLVLCPSPLPRPATWLDLVNHD
jgi:REP-associated tyrosine transposase